MNQCMGCQAGWPRLTRYVDWRGDPEISYSHAVPFPGYKGEIVHCTIENYHEKFITVLPESPWSPYAK